MDSYHKPKHLRFLLFNFRFRLLLAWLLISSQLNSQDRDFQIDHIGYAQGLSGQLIRSIKEDNNGHLWISTFSELNKFDGFQTQIFNSGNSELSNGIFEDLLKDASGNIWSIQVNTDSDSYKYPYSNYFFHSYHINVINPTTHEMTPLDEYLDCPKIKTENLIRVEQRNDIIYLTDKTGTIFSYHKVCVEHCKVNLKQEFIGITNQNTYCIINEDRIIQEYDLNSKLEFNYDINLKESDRVGIGNNGSLLYADSDHNLFEGLYLLFKGQKNLFPKRKLNNDNYRYHHLDENILKQVQLIEGVYPISLIGGQVFFADDQEDFHSSLDAEFHFVNDIESSSSSTHFIATDLGVNIIRESDKIFEHYNVGKNKINSVRGIIKHDDIIISRKGDVKAYAESPDGSYDVDFINEKLQYGVGFYRNPNNKDHIWICGNAPHGLTLIDLHNQKFLNPAVKGEFVNFLKSSVSDILYVYGPSGIYKNLTYPDKWVKEKLSYNSNDVQLINHAAEINQRIFFASDDGLYVFDELEKSGQLITFKVGDDYAKLSFIHHDKTNQDLIWLGTKHHGIIVYNIQNEEQQYINTDLGLSNNNVHAIIEDAHNRLWISTNKYLNCINKSDNSIFVFTTEDGLSHEEFNKYSYFQHPETGHIAFGGLNGYNLFDPNEFNISDKQPNTINITEIKSLKDNGNEDYHKFSRTVADTLAIYEDEVLTSFKFTLKNIFEADKRKFFYRLKEIDNEWTQMDGNKLSITRLPYGAYTLEVIADLYRSRTRSELMTCTLKYIKPFYKSTIFIISLLLLLSLLTYLWLLNRTKRILRKNTALELQINERTSELKIANETKSKILAILTHDMKGPIGGLRNYYEKLDYLLKRDRISEIKEISRISKIRIQNLENTLSNLLTWAMVDSQSLKSKAELLSLNYEVDTALKLFDYIIEKKNLKVFNQLDVLDQIIVDKNILQSILRNIIHNALKFSFSSGIVEIKKTIDSDEHVTISVRDYGLGMDNKAHTPDVLRRLGADKGLGFGLSTTKEIAQSENILIQIISSGIIGTEVLLRFPNNKPN